MSDPPWTEDPDAELVRRVAQGDASACTALVDRYLKRVAGTATRLLGNAADASEVAQDVFLRVWSQASSFDPSRGRFSTWLYRIVLNAVHDRQRLRRPEVAIDAMDLPAQEADPERRAQDDEREARLRAAMATLPARQREALVLFHYEGLSQQEAARALDVTPDALESLLARARRTLRGQLAERIGG